MFTIYGLVASDEPEAVRYVGSTRDLSTRLRKHRSTHADVARSRKEQWVVEVKARGASVDVVILAGTGDLAQSRELEVAMTIQQLAAGADLLNRSPSGAGNLGRPTGRVSDAALERMTAGQRARRTREQAEGVSQTPTDASRRQAALNLAKANAAWTTESRRQMALDRPRVSCVLCHTELQLSRFKLGHRNSLKCQKRQQQLAGRAKAYLVTKTSCTRCRSEIRASHVRLHVDSPRCVQAQRRLVQ